MFSGLPYGPVLLAAVCFLALSQPTAAQKLACDRAACLRQSG